MARRLRHLEAETILNLAQVVALIIGGAWLFFRYLAHERSAASVALEQQQLSLAQSRAVAATQRLAEDARLRQVNLSNAQAETALNVQRESQKLALEQQRLANEHARITLSINEGQRKLRHDELEKTVAIQAQQLRLNELEAAKAEHQLAYVGRYRFSRDFVLTARKRRDITNDFAEYELDYSFVFGNKSEVPFELSLFVIDYYVGLPLKNDPDQHVVIQPLGTPADRWNPTGAEKGALLWERVGQSGSVYAEAIGEIREPWDHAADVDSLAPGGAGTGVLKPEQTIRFDETFIVRAPREAYVAFVMSYCFDRCARNDDLYSRFNWVLLPAEGKVNADGVLAATDGAPKANTSPRGGASPTGQ